MYGNLFKYEKLLMIEIKIEKLVSLLERFD